MEALCPLLPLFYSQIREKAPLCPEKGSEEIILAFFGNVCYDGSANSNAMIGPPGTGQHLFSECGVVGAAWVRFAGFLP